MFESLVRSSIYNVNKRMAQHFSAKARGYMLTYLHKLVKKRNKMRTSKMPMIRNQLSGRTSITKGYTKRTMDTDT